MKALICIALCIAGPAAKAQAFAAPPTEPPKTPFTSPDTNFDYKLVQARAQAASGRAKTTSITEDQGNVTVLSPIHGDLTVNINIGTSKTPKKGGK